MRTLRLIPLLAALASCSSEEPPPVAGIPQGPSREASRDRVGSVNARPDLTEEFRLDRAAERSISDLAGQASLESGGDATVGLSGRWRIAFEVGEPGIAEGGAVYLQVPPFWGWDSPQARNSESPGYTTVEIESDREILAVPEALGPGLFRCVIEGEGLEQGDRVVFDYGAGSMGARPDLYAESGSRFWIAVDGDGDGVRHVHEESPAIRVLPAPATRVALTLTSRARAGENVRLCMALLDRNGNRAASSTARVRLIAEPPAVELPDEVQLGAEDRGATTLEFKAPATDLSLRIRAEVTDSLPDENWSAISNPLQVTSELPRIFWADLHGHSNLSDGTALPEEYLTYARDVAGLDVIALTDHDHYGVRFLSDHPSMWQDIREHIGAFHQPGRFVTVLGYEWTNWTYGHRHVLYFSEEGEVYDSIDEASDHPSELWALLAGLPAMTIAHHSAGAPVATDWSIVPDSTLEPLTEVMSVHGSSEAADSPSRVRGFVRGNAVRDALDRGYRLGFVGSGDSHDGHPGLPHLNPIYGWRPASERRGELFPERMGNGGVTAIIADDLSRESILRALRDRSCYATSGPRILLDVKLGSVGMGSSARPAKEAEGTVKVQGTSSLRSLELIRSGRVVETHAPHGDTAAWTFVQKDLQQGEYLYLRVVQEDGGMAWSSPIWIDRAPK